MDKENLIKKWSPILDSMGVTGSKADWMSEYAQTYQDNTKIEESTSMEFLLPIAMRLADRTIGQDLVNVNPLGSINYEEIDRIKNEVKSENRERKIDALTENKEFEEMKLEDHPDYKIGPTGQLFYLDFKFKYGDTQ